MPRSMFDRYGGFANVSKIVMVFYDRALDSDIIGHYFEDIELPALIDHQTKFIASIMGGPASYTNEYLQRVHASLGIDKRAPDHSQNIAKMALLMRRYLRRRNAAHTQKWECRIGINTGTVIGSIVGVQKYVYDIFGPGVNLTARMESLSDRMEITLCEDMYELIQNDFRFVERGTHEIKGFGKERLYFLDGSLGAIAPS